MKQIVERINVSAITSAQPSENDHAPAGLSTYNAEAEKPVWREALSAIPDLRHEVHEVVVDGDVEMARVIVTGTMTAAFGGVTGLAIVSVWTRQ